MEDLEFTRDQLQKKVITLERENHNLEEANSEYQQIVTALRKQLSETPQIAANRAAAINEYANGGQLEYRRLGTIEWERLLVSPQSLETNRYEFRTTTIPEA